MSVTDTHPDLPAQTATFQHLDEPPTAPPGAVPGAPAGSFVAQAILPFRRFNRNWYRAMAGGALLANSEIAGGAYVFGICGADYTVVCKNLNYTFLRPCFGPAVYRMTAREDIRELVKQSAEFNITMEMEISQQGFRGQQDRRVGRCEGAFHVTPKIHHKSKAAR